jgi:hypothetical protein
VLGSDADADVDVVVVSVLVSVVSVAAGELSVGWEAVGVAAGRPAWVVTAAPPVSDGTASSTVSCVPSLLPSLVELPAPTAAPVSTLPSRPAPSPAFATA